MTVFLLPLVLASALAVGPIGVGTARNQEQAVSVQTGDCKSASELPVRFPFDSLVFRASVIEPALPLEGESDAGDAWVVRVAVTTPIYLPDNQRRVDLLLENDDCRSLDRQTLIDKFLVEDILEIAAVAGLADGVLKVPARWVRLMDENISPGIDTPFEYFAALFDLEGRVDDSQRSLAMRRIAKYLESEQQFQAVVDAYIDNKRMRRQLRTLYSNVHRDR